MTRKDTIIVAVLINAAILIALFVSAIRNEKEEHELVSNSNELLDKALEMPKKHPTAEIKAADGDEVDLVLKQYAQANAATQSPAPVPGGSLNSDPSAPNLSTNLEGKVEKTVDFAEDLKAIANNESVRQEAASASLEKSLSDFINVTVKKGDALEKIARAHQTSVDEIMRLNQMKSTNLRIGQVLKVRPGSKNLIKTVADSTPQYYTVKAGDNPWTIAVKNHLKVDELLKLNNLNEEKARHLKAGDKLRIR